MTHIRCIKLHSSLQKQIVYAFILTLHHTQQPDLNNGCIETVCLGIDCLPDEVLSEILQFVCDSEGDAAILTLSLVCRRWRNLVSDKMFRRKVHFRWLSSAYYWNKATE